MLLVFALVLVDALEACAGLDGCVVLAVLSTFTAGFFAEVSVVAFGLVVSGSFWTSGGNDGSTISIGCELKPTAYEMKNVSMTSNVDMKIPFAFTIILLRSARYWRNHLSLLLSSCK